MSKKSPEFPMAVQCGSVAVKIYRVENKGRMAYTVSYFADGKRKLQMFADFEEAHAHAKSKAQELSRGELDVLELRSKDRIAYVHAVEALKPTGVALELAAKEYAEVWKILGGASAIEAAKEYARRKLHILPTKMIPAAVDELIAVRKREGTTPAYVKVLSVYLNQFKEKFGCPLLSISTSQVADFLREMNVSGRSKNNARAALGTFFRYCKERGWLPKDHDGISLVSKFKEKPNEIEIFMPWEMSQFLAYSRKELIPFLAIGAFAGLRSAEIERLDWSEVHLAERFIEIKAAKAKTASRRLAPITDNLFQWLTPHVQKQGRVVPFDNMAKQIAWLVEDTYEGMQATAEKEGKDVSKVKQIEWKKNALRHSFISYRVADVQNVAQVALEAGNSPQIIFRHYRELVRPAEAKIWFSIVPEQPANVIQVESKKAA